jgi:hypothetical protein
MNQNTSFELSKKLYDNGCRLEPIKYVKNPKDYHAFDMPSFDIIWDICIKYSKEFFGEELQIFDNDNGYVYAEQAYIAHPKRIFEMMLEGMSQEIVEQYIWDNCKFNPENKTIKIKEDEI